ncbi:MFS transporter [Burkholderia cepacia]|uniref:MFS transporter n=1 Tax=Burkholderia cepacia TaxID=292 RepID=UPI00190352C2|nr:MFS transporter [Burkholderia cepacia]MBJ9752221.1 MFS transporter [Burkholderia cepacia]
MGWKRFPYAVLITLLMIHTLAQIDRNVLLGFSSQVIADLGIDNTQYGFLVGSVWVISYAAMAMVMGAIADRFSRTRVVAIGLVIWSVCTAASGSASSFGQLVIARFLVASGEAAVVPAAVALLSELFTARRRSTALGIFFMGIPLGVGCSFLLAGTYGAAHGWRSTFHVLGAIGAIAGLLIAFLKEDRTLESTEDRGAPFATQLRQVLGAVRTTPPLQLAIAGFVLVHMVYAGLSFTQLWLVRERGVDIASITKVIGVAQIVFGTLGSFVGGALGDRFSRRFAGGHAGFMATLVGLCGPLMIAYRFAPVGTALFYTGMCAGSFLPLAMYGPALAIIQSNVPARMRSTITGFTMTLLNVFAIALGNLAVGFLSDRLSAGGVHAPLTIALLATDVLAIASGPLFLALSKRARSKLDSSNVATPTPRAGRS